MVVGQGQKLALEAGLTWRQAKTTKPGSWVLEIWTHCVGNVVVNIGLISFRGQDLKTCESAIPGTSIEIDVAQTPRPIPLYWNRLAGPGWKPRSQE